MILVFFVLQILASS